MLPAWALQVSEFATFAAESEKELLEKFLLVLNC